MANLKTKYGLLVRNATMRDLALEVRFEDYLRLAEEKNCHYCGRAIDWDNPRAYHLDRIDNSLGYLVSNVAVCCRRCNHRKSDSSLSTFLSKMAKSGGKSTRPSRQMGVKGP